MYQSVSDTAIGLFLEKGFDAVSVAEVAAASEISKPTLFRYFLPRRTWSCTVSRTTRPRPRGSSRRAGRPAGPRSTPSASTSWTV